MNEPLSIPVLPLLLSHPQVQDGYSAPGFLWRYICYPIGPKPSGQVSDEIEIALREYGCLENGTRN